MCVCVCVCVCVCHTIHPPRQVLHYWQKHIVKSEYAQLKDDKSQPVFVVGTYTENDSVEKKALQQLSPYFGARK